MRDLNVKRRTFEQVVALTIATELTRTLGPVQPEALACKSEEICRVFGDALDGNGITDEAAAERILLFVPRFLADLNRGVAELNSRLDAAIQVSNRAPCLTPTPSLGPAGAVAPAVRWAASTDMKAAT